MYPVLTLPHLAISYHCWLYAYTAAVGLLVYRSPMVRDSDPIYRPVAELLETHRLSVANHQVILDPSMIMGRGELTVWAHPLNLKTIGRTA